ncbi:hypothetical protein L0F51_14265 [Afifella sp. H1R]|uniref:DUF6212 domain-containing protein n=1 Tax=Afifella sp. H1R TaxID=2908841 RepID=UPI001F415E09|nr:hypothetical protein [Afifella sp. H1R]
MPDPTAFSSGIFVDPDSAQQIFGASSQVFVSESLAERLGDLSHLPTSVTLFDQDGRLRSSGSHPGAAAHVLTDAIPHGVFLIACGDGEQEIAAKLVGFFKRHDARPVPSLAVIDATETDAALLRFTHALLPAMSHRLAIQEEVLGRRESELAEMRQHAEWQQLQLRLGREMVEALGYSTRMLAYEVPAGDRTIGPGGDEEATSLVQRLPVDLAGINAVSLYVVTPKKTSGQIIVTLGPPDLRQSLARAEIAATDLKAGWNDIVLEKAVGPIHGDGVLTVSFLRDAKVAAPLLSLTDETTDRFGLIDPDGAGSLALKIWKGLSPEAFPAANRAALRISRAPLDTAGLSRRLHYIFGAAEEAILRQTSKGGPLSATDSNGQIGLRTLPGKIGGFRLADAISPGTLTVSVDLARAADDVDEEIETAILAIPSQDLVLRDADELRQVVEAIFAQDAGTTANLPASLTRRLPKATRTTLRLTFAGPTERPMDVVLALRNSSGVEIALSASHMEVEKIEGLRSELEPPFARRIPFAELKSRMSYMFGDSEGRRASEGLGFSVFEISDVENFMQTHPLPDGLSGARGVGILPEGLVRVSARVMTSHRLGPDAEYGLFLIERGAGEEDPAAFARAMERFVEDGDTARPDFVIASAKVNTKPNERHDFAIELQTPLAQPADLLCTIRSLSGHISFAWCRWYGLDLTVAGKGAHRLELTGGKAKPRSER